MGENNRGWTTAGTARARWGARAPLLLACAAALLIALVVATTSSSPRLVSAAGAAVVGDCTPAAGWPAPNSAHAAEVLRLVNDHRASLGRPPFATSPTLTAAAVWKARHMAQFGYMQHDDPAPPFARSWMDRVQTCGYPVSAAAAENVAYGFRTPAETVKGWLQSPGHRANIENPSYRAIGIGVAGTSTVYWAQNFGSVVDSGSSPPPPPPPAPPAPPPPPTPPPPPPPPPVWDWPPPPPVPPPPPPPPVWDWPPPPPVPPPPPPPPVWDWSPPYSSPSPSPPRPAQPPPPPASSPSTTALSASPGSHSAPPAPPPPPGSISASAYPTSTMLYAGSVTAGDATGLRDDDGNVFEVGSTTSGTRQTSWYGRVAGVSNGVSSLTVTYRGSHSAPCEQTIYLWNWEIGYWVRFASGGGGPGETEVTFSPGASVASFVSGTSGDGEVAVRVHCTRTDSVAFKSAGDLLRVVFWRTA